MKGSIWSTIARSDLDAAYEWISEFSPAEVDKEKAYPHFCDWLHVGYERAVQRCDTIGSYLEYEYLLRGYLNGFREPHLFFQTNLVPQFAEWGGITVTGTPTAFRVIHSDSAHHTIGSQLISCDGVSPEEWMLANIFPCLGNPSFQLDWLLYSPWIFAHTNPFSKKIREAVFKREDGSSCGIELHYRTISRFEFNGYLKTAFDYSFTPPLAFGITHFDADEAWVHLPSFNPERGEQELLQRVIDELAELRGKRLIVFDLRGNGGGYSSWAVDILERLYTVDYLRSLPIRNKDMYVEYRVAPEIRDSGGVPLPLHGEMTAAMESGSVLLPTDLVDFYRLRSTTCGRIDSPVEGQVVVLTDERAGSSTLLFLDMLLSIPNVIHAGRPTIGDTHYNQPGVRRELPSGLMNITIPCQVRRNFNRGNNETYTPHLCFPGRIGETEELRSWLLKELS